MRVAILGSGFGLYGYLPALVSQGCAIVLPQRYRRTIEARPELVGFLDRIDWQADDRAALDHADALVFARRPNDQVQAIPAILARPRLKRLLLEKPLARDPAEAAYLHAQLATSGKIFRLGYTFPWTEWGQRLISGPNDSETSIVWSFRAHHYASNASNWKRLHSQGGGALRFYGIQIICLLARMGFDRVSSSITSGAAPDEVESWQALFASRDRAPCRVTVGTNDEQRSFAVKTISSATRVSLDDPFSERPANESQDRRVPILAALCGDMLTSDRQFEDSYAATIALWQQVEAVTIHRSV